MVRNLISIMQLLLVSLSLSGCAGSNYGITLPVQGSGDCVHYLIIGAGIVTVPKPDKQTAVLAAKLQAIGLSMSDQPGLKLGIGYSSNLLVAIPEGAEDVRVEVSQLPLGPLEVKTQKATLLDK